MSQTFIGALASHQAEAKLKGFSGYCMVIQKVPYSYRRCCQAYINERAHYSNSELLSFRRLLVVVTVFNLLNNFIGMIFL
jgi:hypothetical protein